MQINISDYESISYVRFNRPLAFDLSQIKECFIKDSVFEVVSHSGVVLSYLSSYIQLNKKVPVDA